MQDNDGDGIYEADLYVPAGEYQFKVRANGEWDYSWAIYEADYDRTLDSQQNPAFEVSGDAHIVIRLNTNEIDPDALSNTYSRVNEAGFDFEKEGYKFWPVSFDIVSVDEPISVVPFDYEENADGTITITKYNGYSEVVEIPAEIDGKTVTAVGKDETEYGEGVFEDNSNIRSVTIPEGVTSIGENAFSYCYNLESVSIPDSVKTIGESAFNNCKALGNVQLPRSLVRLEKYSFMGCYMLRSISIPASVTTVGSGSFEYCENLSSVFIDRNSTAEFGSAVFSACSSLESISFPEGTTIADNGLFLFSGCSSLKNITLPSSVTTYGPYMFFRCPALETLPNIDNITSLNTLCLNGTAWYDSQPDGEVYLNNIFYCYKSSENGNLWEGYAPENYVLKIAEGTTDITPVLNGDGGYTTRNVVEIDIPSTVTKLRSSAIHKICYPDLKRVVIPATVTEIDPWAFAGGQAAALFNFTIYGEEGSAAETFAEKYGYEFEILEKLENHSIIVNPNAKAGENVTIRGLASGGMGAYQYNFAYKLKGDKDYTLLRKFAKTAKASFVPEKDGVYIVRIKVRDETGTIVTKTTELKIGTDLKNISEINKTQISAGESVMILGLAQGGTGFYNYAYSFRRAGTNEWTKIADYSAAACKAFTPDAGEYEIMVSIIDSAGAQADQVLNLSVIKNEVALANNSTISADTVVKGTAVTLTAVAVGGTAPYTYALMYKKSSSSTWTKIGTKYGTESTGTFKPGSVTTYDIMINVKDSTGKIVSKSFKLNVTEEQKDLVNNSVISAETVTKGTAVTLTAKAEGGTAPYTYALMYKKSSSSTWTKIGTKYGTESTGTFKPGSVTTYDIMINVKDATGKIKSKTFTLTVTK